MQAVKDIERVLSRYGIKTDRIYLNAYTLSSKRLHSCGAFLVVDSNTIYQRNKEKLHTYSIKNHLDVIGQNESAFQLCRDKMRANELFKNHNIRVPHSFLFNAENIHFDYVFNQCKKVFKNSVFPMIIKDNFGSSSECVFFAATQEELKSNMCSAIAKARYILFEKFISGQEITVPYVELCGEKIVLPALEITYDGFIYDYVLKNKTFRNGLHIPPLLSQNLLHSVRNITWKANSLVGSQYYSRLDMRIHNGVPYIIEINGEPVLSKNDFLARSSRSVGISYPKLIIGLLANSDDFCNYAHRHNKKLSSFIGHINEKIQDCREQGVL